MSEQDFTARDNPERHRFEIETPQGLAVLEYTLHGSALTLIHTEVPPALQGHGIAGRIVKYALDHARSHAYSVIPSCPYVAQYIARHPEYAGLVGRPNRASSAG